MVFSAEFPSDSGLLDLGADVIKISERQQPEEISPEVIKNDDRSQENKKIAAVQWMTHQRIGAAVTKAPFSDLGIASPRPGPQQLPRST